MFNFDYKEKVDISTIKSLLTDSAVNKNIDELFKVPNGQFWELELNTKQGVQNHNWAFLKSIDGEIILVGYDITEIKATQQKLKESNATKDKFFSIIAHDLRGPVGALNSFLELFTQEGYHVTEDHMKSSLNVMKKASKNTYELLDNLLMWARTQMDEQSFHVQKASLNELLESNVRLFSNIAESKDITLKIDIEPNLIATFDVEMINTVVRNLINNALKFSNKGGVVKISALQIRNMIRVSVEDNGVGMNADLVDKLFQIGAENITTVGTIGEKGSGLGLILCKEFVEKHGGNISVMSKLNYGSVFVFEIPQFR